MPATVSIGRLQFDPDALVLYDDGQIVPLAPLPAQMLAALLRAGGDVVSAAWMRKALWNDAPIEDRNVNQQIYVLRRVLRRDPQVSVENVPRRGYRLVVASIPAAQSAPVPMARRPGRPRAIAWACAVAVLALFSTLIPARESADASDRELALANYLAAAEGPHHLDLAAQYYRSLLTRYPNSAAGNGGLALVDARRALELSADVPARERAFEAAATEAATALHRNPRDSNALTALGIVASVRDHCQGSARRMFDAAVTADPNSETPRAWRAKYFLSLGDFADAGRDFRAISQNVPTSGYAVGSFGEWLLLNRDYVRASAVLSQAVDLGNHPGFTRYWLARAYYLRGLDAQALRLSNLLLAMYPNEASALVIRLHVEAREGNVRAALADLHRIESIRNVAQTDPVALASAEVAMGNRGQAMRAVRQYVASGALSLDEMARLRTDPDLEPIRKDRGV